MKVAFVPSQKVSTRFLTSREVRDFREDRYQAALRIWEKRKRKLQRRVNNAPAASALDALEELRTLHKPQRWHFERGQG